MSEIVIRGLAVCYLNYALHDTKGPWLVFKTMRDSGRLVKCHACTALWFSCLHLLGLHPLDILSEPTTILAQVCEMVAIACIATALHSWVRYTNLQIEILKGD